MSKKSREWKKGAKYRDIPGFKRIYSLKRYKEKKRLEEKILRRMNKDARKLLSKNKYGYSGGQIYKLFEHYFDQTAFITQLVKELEPIHYTPGLCARISINGKQILPQM